VRPHHLAARMSALVLLPATLAAQQQTLPLKHAPQATTGPITAADLMTRLYIFADDSMQGRETGTVGHVTATNYLAAELKKLGLKPAGDNGTYFQALPVFERKLDPTATIAVGGTKLSALKDFVAGGGRGGGAAARSIAGAQVVYGGEQGDTTNALTVDQVRGKLVVIKGRAPAGGRGGFPAVATRGGAGAAGGGGGGGAGGAGRGGRGPGAVNPLDSAAGVATISFSDSAWKAAVAAASPMPGKAVIFRNPSAAPAVPAAAQLTITAHAADVLLGMPVSRATKGAAGKTVTGDLKFTETPAPARNVIAILPGSDPTLRGEYVAIGAHSDHVGFRAQGPLDHDSLHVYRAASFAICGKERGGNCATPEEREAVRIAQEKINLDSIRKAHPVRRDSINNGADDDGSGSVTLLEIAEAFARLPAKPKRSIIFVWHVAEEKGLWGSEFFTDFPTVPRDSIVAQLNMDMVGRGDSQDFPGGGPSYAQLVGNHRVSMELGDLVEAVNKTEKMPFTFDYTFDADFQPENIYCRSDHYNYARYGIPIAYLTTGLHGDYHQVTDEPQYIDYEHMARVGQLWYDVAMKVGNLDHRVVVDHPKPTDPHTRCTNNGAGGPAAGRGGN
jgi:hypothetical protein